MNKDNILAWLKASYTDLIVIEEIIDNDYLTHMVAFHAHQSIEKSFKAILELDSNRIFRKHDLIYFKKLVSKYIKVDNESILEDLNQLYRNYRYPMDFGLLKPTLENAKEFYLFSNDIFDRVCEGLDVSIEDIV